MIAIVDYKAGNLTSVKRALDHLGLESCVTPDPAVVEQAERIIFPGVGHAGTAMAVLKERGLDAALRAAYAAGTPILGTCVGAQIILSHSEEGDTECLGLVAGDCVRFQPDDPALKVPHMGWNEVHQSMHHPLWNGIPDGTRFYFVHSYFAEPAHADLIAGHTLYPFMFTCAVASANVFAVQFHPEKSQESGLQLLKNFAAWKPDVYGTVELSARQNVAA
jgi:imidazole glycerol-phosphate synthase subunit HisH